MKGMPMNMQGMQQEVSYLVRNNGYVYFPMVGDVKLEGYTIRQADSLLSVEYNKYYYNVFVNAKIEMVEGAAACGTDRIELYTEDYAVGYKTNKQKAILPYKLAAKRANELGLGINAGHDLNLENLAYFHKSIPSLLEVSIGHALISDALYYGMENTIQLYLRCLKN